MLLDRHSCENHFAGGSRRAAVCELGGLSWTSAHPSWAGTFDASSASQLFAPLWRVAPPRELEH